MAATHLAKGNRVSEILLFVIVLPGILVLPTTVTACGVTANYSAGFQDAAQYLLQGLDLSTEPCGNFYAFTCNTYIKNSAYGENILLSMQTNVYNQIAAQISNITNSSSLTEQIFAHAYESCLMYYNNPKKDYASQINAVLQSQIGGLPMLTPGWKAPSWDKLWKTIGQWESQYGIFTVFSSVVKVDYGNTSRYALYIEQRDFGKDYPWDIFVKMEYLAGLDVYQNHVIDLIQKFNRLIKGPVSDDDIATAVTNSIKFEILLARGMVPPELMLNYEQQYNPFNLTRLNVSYPNIRWKNYFEGLLQDVDPNLKHDNYVISQPPYLSAVDSMIGGKRIDEQVIADFIGIQMLLLFEDSIAPTEIKSNSNFNNKVRKPPHFIEQNVFDCIKDMNVVMPFGTGYIYVAQKKDRDAIKADVANQTNLIFDSFLRMTQSVPWLDQYSLKNVIAKKDKLITNIGWPDWYNFTDPSYMDNTYHKYYHNITKIEKADYVNMTFSLARALQLTENLGLLKQIPNRKTFMSSPADVDALYVPSINSISIHLAALNPPFYRRDFPQAVNFGGVGAILGHELSHAYDFNGVQFGPEGELSNCTWNRCGWMDNNSTFSFLNMAHCVVEQYSKQCCFLINGYMNCANGLITQDENIADVSGTQAAFKAYRKYIEVNRNGVEEDRLPGLEQFTPNQIFWIAAGYKWCAKYNNQYISSSLLTDVHSPLPCRVNEVVQDIPEFGNDFNCMVNSPMNPLVRCKVWNYAPLD